MSTSHAETAAHATENAAEHVAETESAVETFANGIGKIVDSVRIAIKKVYGGAKGLLKNIFIGIFGRSAHGSGETHGHDAHDTHAAAKPHGEGHGAKDAHAPAPTAAHH